MREDHHGAWRRNHGRRLLPSINNLVNRHVEMVLFQLSTLNLRYADRRYAQLFPMHMSPFPCMVESLSTCEWCHVYPLNAPSWFSTPTPAFSVLDPRHFAFQALLMGWSASGRETKVPPRRGSLLLRNSAGPNTPLQPLFATKKMPPAHCLHCNKPPCSAVHAMALLNSEDAFFSHSCNRF